MKLLNSCSLHSRKNSQETNKWEKHHPDLENIQHGSMLYRGEPEQVQRQSVGSTSQQAVPGKMAFSRDLNEEKPTLCCEEESPSSRHSQCRHSQQKGTSHAQESFSDQRGRAMETRSCMKPGARLWMAVGHSNRLQFDLECYADHDVYVEKALGC